MPAGSSRCARSIVRRRWRRSRPTRGAASSPSTASTQADIEVRALDADSMIDLGDPRQLFANVNTPDDLRASPAPKKRPVA